jgi:hypothetical protein
LVQILLQRRANTTKRDGSEETMKRVLIPVAMFSALLLMNTGAGASLIGDEFDFEMQGAFGTIDGAIHDVDVTERLLVGEYEYWSFGLGSDPGVVDLLMDIRSESIRFALDVGTPIWVIGEVWGIFEGEVEGEGGSIEPFPTIQIRLSDLQWVDPVAGAPIPGRITGVHPNPDFDPGPFPFLQSTGFEDNSVHFTFSWTPDDSGYSPELGEFSSGGIPFFIDLDAEDCDFVLELNCGYELGYFDLRVEHNEIPEPATLGLIGMGLAGLAARMRRKKTA